MEQKKNNCHGRMFIIMQAQGASPMWSCSYSQPSEVGVLIISILYIKKRIERAQYFAQIYVAITGYN